MPRPDLLINMCSFQEMTTAQVENYIAKARAWGIPCVYSINRDHSPNNSELTRVSSIFSGYYAIIRDEYTFEVEPEIRGFFPKSILRRAKRVAKKIVFRPKKDIHAYRHLIGVLERTH